MTSILIKGVLSIIVMLALYMLPFLIAWFRCTYDRRHVFWLNLLLGWSGICWILCIILAFGKTSEEVGDERRAERDLQMQWDRYYRDLARQTVYVPVPVIVPAQAWPFPEPARPIIERRRARTVMRANRFERWS